MSHRATAWAVAQRTGSPTRKAVLVALADRHNGDTRRCNPSVERIAEDTEFSVRSVERALADLEAAGFISRQRARRSDGTLGIYHYVLGCDRVTELPVTESGSPPVRVSGQEPEVNLEPLPSTSVANAPSADGASATPATRISDGPKSVDRKATTADERTTARVLLEVWNTRTGQELRSEDWLSKIIMRMREYPEATVQDHALIIETALANPWWTGPPSPSVVYGNGAQFERSIAQVRQRQTVNADLEVALNRMRRRTA